jgi:hypothetical protein
MHNTKFHPNTRKAFDYEWSNEEVPRPLHHYILTSELLVPLLHHYASLPVGESNGGATQGRKRTGVSRSLPYICIRKQTARDKGTKEDKK